MLVAGSIPGGEFMTHGRGVRPTLSDRAGCAEEMLLLSPREDS